MKVDLGRRSGRVRHLSFAMTAALLAGLLPMVAAAPVAAAGPYLILVGAVPATSPAGNTFTVTVGTSTDGTTVRNDLTAYVSFAAITDASASTSPTATLGAPRLVTGTQQFSVTLPTKPVGTSTVSRTIEFSAAGFDSTSATVLVTTATKLAFITQPGSGSPSRMRTATR